MECSSTLQVAASGFLCVPSYSDAGIHDVPPRSSGAQTCSLQHCWGNQCSEISISDSREVMIAIPLSTFLECGEFVLSSGGFVRVT